MLLGSGQQPHALLHIIYYTRRHPLFAVETNLVVPFTSPPGPSHPAIDGFRSAAMVCFVLACGACASPARPQGSRQGMRPRARTDVQAVLGPSYGVLPPLARAWLYDPKHYGLWPVP